MRFHLVEWHPVRAWLKTDPAAYQLYNYLLFPDRPDIMEHIVEQYRQLVKHYEERRDFESAERFYVSEMELRRSLLGMPIYESGMSARVFLWIRRKFNFYSLYRLSSLYGTRYFQAIGVLLLLIAGGTQILMFTGIKPSEENKDAGRHEIDYLLFSAESRPTSEHVLRDYWDSFTYTVDSVTLQKNKNFEPNLGKVAQIIIFLSVAAQGAMFLLALRRRFKRD
jgi:hypothetical protein